MAGAEAKASLVRGPVSSGRANSAGDDFLDGVGAAANTGASQNMAIPAKHRGKFCSMRVTGASCDVSFSKGAAQTLVANAVGTLEAPNAQTGYPIPQDGALDIIIPPDATHVNWIASGAAGYFKIYISEILAMNG